MKVFFDSIRRDFGPLNQGQVDGFETLYKASADLPVRHQAYVLATAWHETAATMQPIEEYGKGKGREYGKPAGPYGKVYYGRGYVQLTWYANYQKAGLATGRDLALSPEQAMIPEVAADIIVRGMSQGWFTGKKMADYQSYVDMRRVVNGTDKAQLIAGYAGKIERALMAQADIAKPIAPPPPVEEYDDAQGHEPKDPIPDAPKVDVTTSHNIAAIVLGGLGALIAAVAAWIGFGK